MLEYDWCHDRKIGIQYLFEDGEEIEWWWDSAENVVLFSDPDLRIWVPSTEWDSEAKNHWEAEEIQSLRFDAELSFNGHTPFGALKYPHANQTTIWQQYLLWIRAIVVLLAILIIGIVKKKQEEEKR